MYAKISELSDKMSDELVELRRDFHKYAETGWLEMRTASLIARKLKNLGYTVLVGKDVCDDASRMGLPSREIFETNYERAKAQGADDEYLELVKAGFTGVIGILKNGEGPVIAMRFDIDALGVIEASTDDHIPFKKGFSSVNVGAMHACGHDGHAAIGLGVAKILMDIKNSIKGTIKLIFQPAEEGVRGAKSIVEKGHLDDVDYLLGSHISSNDGTDCDLAPGTEGALATTKLDVYYHGVSAHAGGSPEKGKNVMLSAATAITNLYAIPRNSKGATRINVGTVNAGTGRNVIADIAKMELEIRGETDELNKYMEDYAFRILKSSAQMHDTEVEISKVGEAFNMKSDKELIDIIRNLCKKNLKSMKITEYDAENLGGSEDFSYMMRRVQEHGGKATFFMAMTDVYAPAHNRKFDFEERVLANAVKIFACTAYKIMNK